MSGGLFQQRFGIEPLAETNPVQSAVRARILDVSFQRSEVSSHVMDFSVSVFRQHVSVCLQGICDLHRQTRMVRSKE